MISKRWDCRGRKCMTELHGSVHRQTSTTHKVGDEEEENA